MALINKLSAIGNAIREKTGKTDLLTLDQMPEEISGIETGGGDSYYDTFWDSYQAKGSRGDYNRAFFGSGWNNTTFKPKYNIAPTVSAIYMFYNTSISNLSERLREYGVTLDTSQTKDLQYMFQYSKTSSIPHISFESVDVDQKYVFASCSNLKTIEKITVKESLTWQTTMFAGCTVLENVRFEGVLNVTTSFRNSPLLTMESVDSIINVLKDLTGETAKTISFHADVKAKLTETQIASITSKNWTLA